RRQPTKTGLKTAIPIRLTRERLMIPPYLIGIGQHLHLNSLITESPVLHKKVQRSPGDRSRGLPPSRQIQEQTQWADRPVAKQQQNSAAVSPDKQAGHHNIFVSPCLAKSSDSSQTSDISKAGGLGSRFCQTRRLGPAGAQAELAKPHGGIQDLDFVNLPLITRRLDGDGVLPFGFGLKSEKTEAIGQAFLRPAPGTSQPNLDAAETIIRLLADQRPGDERLGQTHIEHIRTFLIGVQDL